MLHYALQHVSNSTLLIIRMTNCITTASGTVTLCKQPYNIKVESSALHLRKGSNNNKQTTLLLPSV